MNIKEWYLAWTPGANGYGHDDIIIAVGLKSCNNPVRYSDVILWLGSPDKVSGNPKAGEIVYYFENQTETAASWSVLDGIVINFGTITRNTDNTKRLNEATGEEEFFNIIDLMEDYEGSEMKNTPNGLESAGASPQTGTPETHP